MKKIIVVVFLLYAKYVYGVKWLSLQKVFKDQHSKKDFIYDCYQPTIDRPMWSFNKMGAEDFMNNF